MAKVQSASKVRRSYQFIQLHQDQYAVKTMCRLLNVTRSGYYAWLREPISNRAQEDARLLRLIRTSFIASHGIYGAPRVFLDLREAGETCSKHRVARLMRQANLRALHGYRIRRSAIGKPSVLIPNLLQRQFTVTRPNKAWVTDITYIRTWQGRLYLAVVMDLFSRKIIGWSARRRHNSSRTRAQCCPDGRASATAARHDDSFRSGDPVWQRRLAAILSVQSPGTEHEPQGQLLGQCRRRVVLQQSEKGTNQEADLQGSRTGEGRRG